MEITTAKSLANAFIKAHIKPPEKDCFVIVEAGIKEDAEGWYFPFQTERFLATRDIQYSIVGNWPVWDGTIVEQRRPPIAR
jgi:immunity protein 35 of polymorphic toxin system